jgi:hypothetical protein
MVRTVCFLLSMIDLTCIATQGEREAGGKGWDHGTGEGRGTNPSDPIPLMLHHYANYDLSIPKWSSKHKLSVVL